MIVTCPACETSFAVEDSLLGPRGRKVRCSACQNRWHQLPEGDDSAGSAAQEPAPAAAPEASASAEASQIAAESAEMSPPPVRGPKLFDSEDDDVLDDGARRFAVLGWSIFLVVFALLASGFYFGQKHIVAFEPRFQRLYDLVGLPTHEAQDVEDEIPGEGLSIPADKLLKSRKRVGGEPMIVVEGVVINETDSEKPLPTLRATVANADAEVLARWYFEAAAAEIGPKGEISFGTSIKDSWGRQGIGISIIFVSEKTAEKEPSILPSAGAN
jgi:predicted Zn finger-like uncharacterized protein